MHKRFASVMLLTVLLCAWAIPCAAVSQAQLVGYWKGTIKMTVRNEMGYPAVKRNARVKISLGEDGRGSFRNDDQFGSTYIGHYSLWRNRFALDTYLDGRDEYPLSFYDMTVKLNGSKLTLKGRMESMESYSSNVVLSLTRAIPEVKSVKSGSVALGQESRLTVKTDTSYSDFIRMTDQSGDELAFSDHKVGKGTFSLTYQFGAKSNKVKIYAGMRTDDGFVFWSKPKSVTVRCK